MTGGSSAYYDLPKGCKTLQDIIVAKEMSYTRGNIFKAVYRWEEKGVNSDNVDNKRYNLEKIIWFAQDALDRLNAQDPNNPRGCDDEQK